MKAKGEGIANLPENILRLYKPIPLREIGMTPGSIHHRLRSPDAIDYSRGSANIPARPLTKTLGKALGR
ncbi:MAG: hypothetical protein U0R17_02130 [Acidimicrobiia bacterium]